MNETAEHNERRGRTEQNSATVHTDLKLGQVRTMTDALSGLRHAYGWYTWSGSHRWTERNMDERRSRKIVVLIHRDTVHVVAGRHVYLTLPFTNDSAPHYSSMWIFWAAPNVTWRYNWCGFEFPTSLILKTGTSQHAGNLWFINCHTYENERCRITLFPTPAIRNGRHPHLNWT
jgi:hypothetical protein